jgi:hypothetical protein
MCGLLEDAASRLFKGQSTGQSEPRGITDSILRQRCLTNPSSQACGKLACLEMAARIRVDRQYLHYEEGPYRLRLPVEWAYAKTADHPIDFEIQAGALDRWTEPADAPIDAVRREAILDEICSYYANGPAADILGEDGALLRGPSKYRFYLQIPPTPSRYYEPGLFLSIPMAPPVHGSKERRHRFILDFNGVREWTSPRLPIDPQHLRMIARRIVEKEQIGVIGIEGLQ